MKETKAEIIATLIWIVLVLPLVAYVLISFYSWVFAGSYTDGVRVLGAFGGLIALTAFYGIFITEYKGEK